MSDTPRTDEQLEGFDFNECSGLRPYANGPVSASFATGALVA
jgi:hypothetical protein